MRLSACCVKPCVVWPRVRRADSITRKRKAQASAGSGTGVLRVCLQSLAADVKQGSIKGVFKHLKDDVKQSDLAMLRVVSTPTKTAVILSAESISFSIGDTNNKVGLACNVVCTRFEKGVW
jgi:hypothetical protein